MVVIILVSNNFIQELCGKRVINSKLEIEAHCIQYSYCHAKHLPLLCSLVAAVCNPVAEVHERLIPDSLLVEDIPVLRIIKKQPVKLDISIISLFNKTLKEYAHSHL